MKLPLACSRAALLTSEWYSLLLSGTPYIWAVLLTSERYSLLLSGTPYFWAALLTSEQHSLLLSGTPYFWAALLTSERHSLLLSGTPYFWAVLLTSEQYSLLLPINTTAGHLYHLDVIWCIDILFPRRRKKENKIHLDTFIFFMLFP